MSKKKSSSKKVQIEEASFGGLSIYALSIRLLGIGVIILIVRIVFTFILALINGRQWHIEWFGALPVIAFGSDTQTFAAINSTSVLLSSLFVFAVTFYSLYEFHRDSTRRLNAVAWTLGTLLILIQYVVLVVINSKDRFAFDGTIGFAIVPVALAILLLYNYIQSRK